MLGRKFRGQIGYTSSRRKENDVKSPTVKKRPLIHFYTDDGRC